MSLDEIMHDMVENSSIYKINDYKLNIIHDKTTNAFMWCDDNGMLIPENGDFTGY